MDGMKRVNRIVLETTLKPFKKLSKRAIREVSHELFRQWDPLICSAHRGLCIGIGGRRSTDRRAGP